MTDGPHAELRTIAGAPAGQVFRPPLPKIESVHDDRVWFVDVRGRRWVVSDARKDESPRVYRVPPDPEATHRAFWRDDGLRAVADLAQTRPVLQYHGVEDGSVHSLSIALEHALDRTPGARERLAR